MKDIRDKAEAMAAYARQAKDTEMIQWATEIKVRAERKAGELLAAMKQRGELAKQGGDRKSESKPNPTTLIELGVRTDESARWQSLAGMSEAHFETAVATAKDTAGEVTAPSVLPIRLGWATVQQLREQRTSHFSHSLESRSY